ncbi:hypothetical protein ES703_34363 [subsurface metagenome]
MGINPGLITCDFSPQLISAIKHVYGADVIQIDLFHVMQELNRGIKIDLQIYRERQFDAERRELRSLRNWITSIQKTMEENTNFSTSLIIVGNLTEVDPSHELSMNCLNFTSEVIEILKLNDPSEFFRKLRHLLGKFDRSAAPFAYFYDMLLKLMPKKRFTQKGMLRIKKEVLKKLKTYYLWFRKPMDEISIQFYHDLYVIFFQPEKMTPKRKDLLEMLLSAHPDLKIYRELTLLLGELSRLPVEDIDGHQIDDLHENPSFSKKLNTAIKTIKKHKDNILRFVDFFKQHPNLLKSQRSTMEYYNQKFKQPFESGNNLLKKERLLGRLHTQLSGKIEWYLDEEVVI